MHEKLKIQKINSKKLIPKHYKKPDKLLSGFFVL